MANTILIVEDHNAVRESLLAWLGSSFPQHEVIATANGEEAVKVAAVTVPDVVVMDISLPGISGIEAAQQIKRHTEEVQVVMLTIHEEQAYQADAEAAGASAFVPKRLMQSMLLPTLKGLLPPVERATWEAR